MKFNRQSVLYSSIAIVAALVTVMLTIPVANAMVAGLTYYANDGTNFVRSVTPFSFQTTDYDFSQTVHSEGGIRTTLTPRTTGIPYADFGFGYTYGRLGDITSILISGSGSFTVNIYFDMNSTNDVSGNGPFFNWSDDILAGLGGDTYGLGPTITNSGTITPGDSVFLMLNGNTYTIAQLQSGVIAGIGSSTVVGFWFGVTNHPTTAQFEIYLINGMPVAPTLPQPVGGTSVLVTSQALTTLNILQLVGPWIVLTLTGAAIIVTVYRRLFKKHS